MSLNLRKGLYSKLVSDSAIKALVGERIYYQQAPTGADFPYVIFDKTTGTKIRALQAKATIKTEVWMVKGVDRSTSSNVVDELADAIDALLDEGTITVSERTVLDLHLVGDFAYPENSGDQQYRHAGGNYAVVLS